MKYLLSSLLIIGFSVTTAHAGKDWKNSQYGKDDTIGAANRLSPELVLNAANLIKTGKVYSMGTTVSEDSPAYNSRRYRVVTTQGTNVDGSYGKRKATFHDDLMIVNPGIGSQIDGLGHAGVDHVYYNGIKPDDFSTRTGLTKLGTEGIPPIVTRGVLLDMASYFDVEIVKEGTAFNEKEILGAAKKQGVTIQDGDVIIFHTGWQKMLDIDEQKWLTMHPGLGLQGASFLADKGVVAVGADTSALEVIPFEKEDDTWVVHQELLAKNGVYILESLWTQDLAEDNVSEFLFVLGQPKFRGTVQMVINPIAIN